VTKAKIDDIYFSFDREVLRPRRIFFVLPLLQGIETKAIFLQV
jgi:hypothetical protein